MADNKGQAKLHKVRQADGTVIEMTQADWRARDKNAGLVRLEEDGVTEAPDQEGDTDTDA